jgi:signal transduction histidine kinase/FixJ family two-component response regulator
MGSLLEEGGRTSSAVVGEQVRTLYRQSVWIMMVNPLNAAIVGAVIWQSTRHSLIAIWVGLTLAVTLSRAALRRRYFLAAAPPEAVSPWGRRAVIGAAIAGALWGAGGALFYDPHLATTQLILIFVVGGMIAGAAGTLACYLPAFFAYATPAVVGLSARIIAEGDRLHVAMGGLCIVYGVALAMVATNTHRAIIQAFRLRFENDALLGRLSGAQLSLEESNRVLERRVAERGEALARQAEALREARRMESLGRLAGGVAHDFNNLLTVILGNTLVQLADQEVSAATRDAMEEIRGAAERASSLVRQLLAFSRRQLMMPRVLDLNTVVLNAQKLLVRLIGEHIELRVVLHGSALMVLADPVQLEQVIINLATNARDAMSGGGKLTIETGIVEVAGPGEPDAPPVRPGVHVVLAVRDTGVGMDAETRRLAFHPFFTTKDVGQGTGLGLASVYGIVEQSGGHVFVDSEPGKGSCFRVFLPRTELPVAIDTTAGASPPVARALGATVLLAEDERMVRRVTAQVLAHAGFVVIEAENGEDALQRARAYKGRIDVLVTDVVMRKMGGLVLAAHLLEDRPGIPVLYVSGHSRDAALPALDVGAGIDFLQKPFTPDVLAARVARLLAASAAHPSARDPALPRPRLDQRSRDGSDG